MTEQCKQDVLSASILLQQRRDIKGGRPLLPPQYAGMAELADALDLGSSGQPCGFDSHYPYQSEQDYTTCSDNFFEKTKRFPSLLLLEATLYIINLTCYNSERIDFKINP